MRGGLVVEPRTPEREVGVRSLLMSLNMTQLLPKVSGNIQGAVTPSRHDGKLFHGTLRKGETKKKL